MHPDYRLPLCGYDKKDFRPCFDLKGWKVSIPPASPEQSEDLTLGTLLTMLNYLFEILLTALEMAEKEGLLIQPQKSAGQAGIAQLQLGGLDQTFHPVAVPRRQFVHQENP